jgi:hypothetical protein
MFRAELLDAIVDPMVFRSAEIFFHGSTDATNLLKANPEQIWKALSGDIGSLTSFFDQIILAERLPIINYWATYELQPGLRYDRPWICKVVNEELEEHVVWSVDVKGDVRDKASWAAQQALPGPAASDNLKEDVVKQLDAFNYQWRPMITVDAILPLPQKLSEEEREKERSFVRFLYGGLLFSAFSQMSGSYHVPQPKRWQLLTAMLSGAPSASDKDEQALFAELDRRIQAHAEYKGVHLESLPHFLPYLLLSAKPRRPIDLLRAAKELRKDPLVAEYRKWRRELLWNWIAFGRIDKSHEQNIKHVALKIHKRLQVDKHVDVEFLVGVKAGEKGVGLEVGIKVPVPIGRIWGWILEQIPGHGRHMKVLTRLKLAEQRYAELGTHLSKIWKSV